ncbi:MAG: YceI family protein [Chromatiales bacterium]|nr:YceI family protein [Chromatiales bacterium]
MRARLLLLLAALVLSLAGCRAVRETPSGAAAPPQAAQPVPAGFTRYQVVSAESEIRALVYRDGPMARLGHNHVLSSRALHGEILLGGQDEPPRFTLTLPVASFSVDDAALRVEEGEDFPGAVDPDAIAGTRRNLLSTALLDGANFPDIRLTGREVAGQAPGYTVTVAIDVKGRSHEVQVPVLVEQRADGLRVTGQFTATHADLGLTPFSVMGGLLSVRDEIRLRFRIVARP